MYRTSALPAYGRGNVLAAPVQNVVTHVNTEALDSVRGSILFKPNEDLSMVGTVPLSAHVDGRVR